LSQHIPVIEDYLYAGIDFSRDPEILVPPGEEQGKMGKFASLFFFFLIYHFFIPYYLTDMCLLCVDVGPVRLADYAKNKRLPQSRAAPTAVGGPIAVGELPVGEAERVLRQVQRNFTSLTRTIPMEEIEDLPPSM
jgi:hypothetical protein